MKIYKKPEIVLPCCFDMMVQFKKDVEPKHTEITKDDILSFFFYDMVSNDVNLQLLEQGIDGETKEPFLHYSWYVINYCPFCGAKIDIID